MNMLSGQGNPLKAVMGGGGGMMGGLLSAAMGGAGDMFGSDSEEE